MGATSQPQTRLVPLCSLAGLLLAAGLLFGLAWQSPRPVVISIGEDDALFVSGMNNPEAGPQQLFRWTRGTSSLTFLGVGVGTWHLSLDVALERTPTRSPPTVVLQLGPATHTFAQLTPRGSDFQTYTIGSPVPATALGDVTVVLTTTPTFAPPPGDRTLGVELTRAVLTASGPVLPPPGIFLALLGAIGVLFVALAALGGVRLALGGAGLVTLLLAGLVAWNRLWVTPFASYLLLFASLGAASVLLARAIFRQYAPLTVPASSDAWRGPVLAGLLVVVLSWGLVVFGAELVFAFTQPRAVDFQARWESARLLSQGVSLYDPAGLRANPFLSLYKYPPLFAGLIRPLTLFDFDTARNLWRGLDLGFLLMGVAIVIRTFAHPLLPTSTSLRGVGVLLVAPPALALLFLTAIFRPVIDALNYGQLDPPILLLLALTLAALRAHRPGWAGVALALATALKVYPVLLVLFLLWRREWRAVASFAGALIGWIVVGALLTSFSDTVTYITQVLPLSGGTTAWVENQTWSGFLARLFTDQWPSAPFPSTLPLRLFLLNALTYAGAAAVLGFTLWQVRRPAVRGSVSYALGFGAVLAASIFMLPTAWLHYMVAFLLPLGAVFYALQQDGAAWWQAAPRRLIGAVVLIGGGALLLAYENIWIFYDRVNFGGLWTLILSYKFYGAVAVWAGILLLLDLAGRTQPADTSMPAAGSAVTLGGQRLNRPDASPVS